MYEGKIFIAEIKICYNQKHPTNFDKINEILLLYNKKDCLPLFFEIEKNQ